MATIAAAAEKLSNGVGYLPLHANGYTNGDSGISEDHEELPSSDDEDGDNNNKVVSIEDRIKRKAKRPSALLAAKEAALVNGHKLMVKGAHPRFSARTLAKNSRRSRAGFGRGLPKKGGAGGKGTWGKIGSELIAEEEDIEDIKDPNYDSDSQENIELESFLPELTEEELEKYVDPILHEYYEHGDTNEVVLSLDEINLKGISPHLVVMSINLAMERKPSHREMTSVMISDLFGRVLTQEDIGKGFDILLKSLPDLVLDTPDAPMVLGNFIARAVADDCLPPSFVQGYRGRVGCEHARASLEHADTLLSMKHGLVRLDNVWNVGGGMRPVKYLIRKIQLLLQEFLSSGDLNEAVRCLQELEVPHFHHELVYEAVIMVIEDMGERAMDLMVKLLKFMAGTIIVTPDQMKRGFERVFRELPEISIDVPPAYTILENLLTKCHVAGFVPQDLVKMMPSRGRKRFVSEGDGGRVKEDDY